MSDDIGDALRVALAFSVFALVGCEPPSQHKFGEGDCVLMKIDGRRGMVVRAYDRGDLLRVRFAGLSVATETNLLGADGPVKIGTYALEYIREFEVEACK